MNFIKNACIAISVICATLVLVMLSFSAHVAVIEWVAHPNGRFGPNQTSEAVEARYARCVAKAKEGWDCVMVPMLVSEEFVREHNHE